MSAITPKLKKYQLSKAAEASISKYNRTFFVKNAKKFNYADITDEIVEGLWNGNLARCTIFEAVKEKKVAKAEKKPSTKEA